MFIREMPQMWPEPPSYPCKEGGPPDLCWEEGQEGHRDRTVIILPGWGWEAITKGVPTVLVMMMASWVSSFGKMQ